MSFPRNWQKTLRKFDLVTPFYLVWLFSWSWKYYVHHRSIRHTRMGLKLSARPLPIISFKKQTKYLPYIWLKRTPRYSASGCLYLISWSLNYCLSCLKPRLRFLALVLIPIHGSFLAERGINMLIRRRKRKEDEESNSMSPKKKNWIVGANSDQ